MGRKYSITKDQRQFREIVLNKHMTRWRKVSALFFSSDKTKRVIKALRNYNIPEPYATDIAHRFLDEAYNIFEKT